MGGFGFETSRFISRLIEKIAIKKDLEQEDLVPSCMYSWFETIEENEHKLWWDGACLHKSSNSGNELKEKRAKLREKGGSGGTQFREGIICYGAKL